MGEDDDVVGILCWEEATSLQRSGMLGTVLCDGGTRYKASVSIALARLSGMPLEEIHTEGPLVDQCIQKAEDIFVDMMQVLRQHPKLGSNLVINPIL